MDIAVVIVTRNRSAHLQRCLNTVMSQNQRPSEIIIVDNNSDDNTCALIEREFPEAAVLKQSYNSGAAGGRNIGIQASKSDVCISLDDDAIFLENDVISKVRQYFVQNPKLGALAMRIVDQDGAVIKKLIPRRDRKDVKQDTISANFSGTGFAVRTDVFVQLGGFWDQLNPYFGEEPDYCYRMIEKGYQVLMTPHVQVQHVEAWQERPPERRLYCGTRNAPWMALRSLPWPAVISLTILSWGYFFLVACRYGQFKAYLQGIRDSISAMPHVYRIRKPISKHTCRTIRKGSGLFYY